MKKNQISDRKIKSCWIDLIWNLLLDLTWFIFAVFDVKSFWLLIFMWQGKWALVGRSTLCVPCIAERTKCLLILSISVFYTSYSTPIVHQSKPQTVNFTSTDCWLTIKKSNHDQEKGPDLFQDEGIFNTWFKFYCQKHCNPVQ